MNKSVLLLREMLAQPDITQRELSARLDLSLGSVNSLIACAKADGSLNDPAAFLAPYKVDNAVIMAAGFGSRFVPLTWETPKGLIEVFGERMIERLIRQLHDAGIYDVTIVVGYLKEKFDYLIDKYGVKLIYNPDFAHMNNISSLYHARACFEGKNTYLLTPDVWIRDNLFNSYEADSWYGAVFAEGDTSEWCLTYNKKNLITDVNVGGRDSYVMIGPMYLSREFNRKFLPEIEKYYRTPGKEQDYWEDIYVDWIHGEGNFKKSECPDLYIRKLPDGCVYEFDTLEDLRKFDERYIHSSDNAALATIASVLKCSEADIHDIRCLKAGMTNRSFSFAEGGKKYICRIPGEGTAQLINRKHEGENFAAVKKLGITETIVYFDPETGYKITEYYHDSRVADPKNPDDIGRCMKLLKSFHESGVSVAHDFDIEQQLDFYEDLCMTHGGIPFEDYRKVRKQAQELIDTLKTFGHKKVLAHIDSVPDNFLFTDGDKKLHLIDWEYSGMADPLIDLAMWSIYSYYDKDEADRLMAVYFSKDPAACAANADAAGICPEGRYTVYAYMALGGLLWALWAVYKSQLGVNFGDYTLVQYRYAKDYYRFCKEIL